MNNSEHAICSNCDNLLIVEYAEPDAGGAGMVKLTYRCAYCVQKANRFAKAFGMPPILGLTQCDTWTSASHPDYQVWKLATKQ